MDNGGTKKGRQQNKAINGDARDHTVVSYTTRIQIYTGT